MDEVEIERTRKTPNAARIAGGVVGVILVTAATALFLSATVWAVAAMWRSVLS